MLRKQYDRSDNSIITQIDNSFRIIKTSFSLVIHVGLHHDDDDSPGSETSLVFRANIMRIIKTVSHSIL